MGVARTLLLIGMLFFGQAHACAAVFLCEDGDVCKTCATAPCPDESALEHQKCVGADPCATAKGKPDECDSCCQIQGCPEGDPAEAQATRGEPICVAALIHQVIRVPAAPVVDTCGVSIHIEAHRAHAPPGESDTRAPPMPSA